MYLQSSGLEFKPAEIEAEYALNVLWLDKSIGLAVDQIFKGVSWDALCCRLCILDRPGDPKPCMWILWWMMQRQAASICRLHGMIAAFCTAGPEESHHRVLLLAQDGCVGGAQCLD